MVKCLERRLKLLPKTIRFNHFTYLYIGLNLFFMFVQELVTVKWLMIKCERLKILNEVVLEW